MDAGAVTFHLSRWRETIRLLERVFGAAIEEALLSPEIVVYTGRAITGEWVA